MEFSLFICYTYKMIYNEKWKRVLTGVDTGMKGEGMICLAAY